MEKSLIVTIDSHDTVQDIVINGYDASELVNTPDIQYIAITGGSHAEIPVRVSFSEGENGTLKVTATVEFSGDEKWIFLSGDVPAENVIEAAEELIWYLLER